MYVLVLVILSIIMAGILQAAFKKLEVPGGYWNRLLGSFVGALVGDLVLGNWGWMLAGFNVIAGIIGSFVIGWLYIAAINRYSVNSSKSHNENI